uniref:Uncharacterized protein n=1 Tax=Anguilla anguilla TaxID=7936 RepID=A0A0E9QIE8_ANGAN
MIGSHQPIRLSTTRILLLSHICSLEAMGFGGQQLAWIYLCLTR